MKAKPIAADTRRRPALAPGPGSRRRAAPRTRSRPRQHRQSNAMDDEPEHRAQDRTRSRETHGREDAVQHRARPRRCARSRGARSKRPARAPRARAARPLGGLAGTRARLPRARPAHSQHGGEAHAQAARLLGRRGGRLERHREQARGLVEGQLGDRLLRGALREPAARSRSPAPRRCRAIASASASGCRLEGARELRVVLAQRRGAGT